MSPTTLPWLVTIVCLAVVVGTFAYVILGSKNRDENYSGVMQHAYGIRKIFFILFLIFGVAIASMTLTNLPYDAHANVAEEAIEVDVTGHQWYWDIEKTEFQVGQPVIFNVTSSDVNHGFGIYDEDLTLLNQTQAMPGYINKLAHTFDKPGKYKVLCLEYCGLSHHAMVAELTVTDNKEK